MRARNRAIAALSAAAVLALPASALADQSALSGYGYVGGVTQSDVGGGDGHQGSSTRTVVRAQGTDSGSGSLPFTGFDALAVGAVGVLLAGAGVSLRRLSVRNSAVS
jgi:hypothetical protein